MATDNSEEIEKLNETIRSLQSNLEGLNGTIGNLSKSIDDGSKVADKHNKAVEKGLSGMSQFGNGIVATGKGLMDTSAGLSKYSKAVDLFGGAVGTAAKGLGILAGPVTLLVTVITKLVGAALEFNDNVLKAHDSLADMGATLGNSTTDLIEMGRRAGYSSEKLIELTRITASVGKELTILGGSSSQGVKAFSEIAAISSDQRQKFRNLGFSQEQVTEMQAVFVKQLAQTGGTLAKTPKQLQEESTKYIKELNVLSEITGVSAKKQQEAMDKALANENFNAFMHKKERERDAEADPIKKANIQAEIDKRKALAAVIVATEGAASATGKLQALSSENGEVITEQTAALETGGQSMAELVKSTKDSTKTAGEIVLQNMRAVGKSVRDFEDTMGDAGHAYGQASIDSQKAFAQDNEARALETRVRNMSAEDAKKLADDLIKKQQDKEKTEDQILKARNKLEEDAIAARAAFEKGLQKANEGILAILLRFAEGIENAIKWLGDWAENLKNFNWRSLLPGGGGAPTPPVGGLTPGAQTPQQKVMAARQAAVGAMPAPAAPTTGRAPTAPAAPTAGGAAAAPVVSIAGRPANQTTEEITQTQAAGKKLDDLLAFGSKSGSAVAFSDLDKDIQQRVLAAAEQYYSSTKKKLIVNSAKRSAEDQERLYAETIKAGRPGIGPSGMAVAKPGTSNHERGLAIDIQQGIDDRDAVAALNAQGLFQTVKGDPVHFQIPKAKDGMIAKGPASGYLVEQHGLELTAPLDPNSILKKLAETSAAELNTNINKPVAPDMSVGNDATVELLKELVSVMNTKFDTVIDKISSSNDIQDKILSYSMI